MVVEVTCAIIGNAGKVLAVQKGEHTSLAYKWEFPGGKVELGETYQQSLLREIKEELNVKINILRKLPDSYYKQEIRTIRLIPYVCCLQKGECVELIEHNDLIWLPPQELNTLNWVVADLIVIDNYLKYIASKT